jgi:antitoxin HicB
MNGTIVQYPALIEPDTVGFMVSFRDIPEALTCGATLEEARHMAALVLVDALDFYIEDGRALAAPSAAQAGEELIELPAEAVAKIRLLEGLAK